MSIQTKEEFEQEVIDLFLNTKMSLRAIAQKYDRKSYDFIYGILKNIILVQKEGMSLIKLKLKTRRRSYNYIRIKICLLDK